jgi:hypothetical protein
MWSGEVWAVSPGAGPRVSVLRHETGVQSMAVVDGRLFIVGLDGVTAWYSTDGEPLTRRSHRLEPVVWGTWVQPGYLIVAGAERVYRLDIADDELISLELLPDATGALVEGSLAAVYDGAGHGVRFDSELEVCAEFRSPPGARPVATNTAGTVLVTAHPDGSHALLVDDRVIYVHRSGPMAIAPDGSRVGLASESGVVIAPISELSSR